MSDLADKYPEIKDAWNDYEIRYLTTAGSIDTYNILMTEPIESLADLQGKKIGGVGSNMLFLKGSGAAGVTSGLSDWYNNMATGLLDGILVWPEAVVAYRLYEIAALPVGHSIWRGYLQSHRDQSAYLESVAGRGSTGYSGQRRRLS